MFVRDSIAFNSRPDLTVDGLEATWIELLLPQSKGILICAAYRPPNDSGFLSKFELSLSRIVPGTEFYILGDINIGYKRNTLSELQATLQREEKLSRSLLNSLLV